MLELAGKEVMFLLVRTEGKLYGHGVHVSERKPSVHLPYHVSVIVCMALCVCAWIHVCTMSLCVHVCNFHCVYVIARLWRSDDNFQHQPLIPHFETGSLWCSHCGYWANWFMICRAFFRFPSHHKSVVMTDVCYYLRRLMGSGVSNSGLQPTILN